MVTVKVLGSGCPNCMRLEALAKQAAQEACVEATFVHEREIAKIMKYPITGTPGLVINEVVKSYGRIPAKEEIVAWLKEAVA